MLLKIIFRRIMRGNMTSWTIYFWLFILCKKKRNIEKAAKVIIVDVHRASYAKHLRNKTHLENFGKQDMIIPEWLFMQPIEKTTKIKEPQAFRTNCQRKF